MSQQVPHYGQQAPQLLLPHVHRWFQLPVPVLKCEHRPEGQCQHTSHQHSQLKGVLWRRTGRQRLQCTAPLPAVAAQQHRAILLMHLVRLQVHHVPVWHLVPTWRLHLVQAWTR